MIYKDLSHAQSSAISQNLFFVVFCTEKSLPKVHVLITGSLAAFSQKITGFWHSIIAFYNIIKNVLTNTKQMLALNCTYAHYKRW